MPFTDRREAGRRLAGELRTRNLDRPVVLALPRGGVPVALEVAEALTAPLDLILVRKLGVPSQPELGMGALGEGGVRLLNDQVLRGVHVSPEELARVEADEQSELERRARRYRGDRPPLELAGRTVIVIDDGIATGFTARAACQVAKARGAARVILAVPVAPAGSAQELGAAADEFVCLSMPSSFFAIGQFYDDFRQVTDQEVIDLLARAAAPHGGRDEDVTLDLGGVELGGRLTLPAGAAGIVVFAHGSGSSRHSPRNRFVAEQLNAGGVGTLLVDLLTPEEAEDRGNVFDIGLLAGRLRGCTDWLRHEPEGKQAQFGYFGASTGAAAALVAAADPADEVAAIVSRGGRPDLAGDALPGVRAPTLLIVGGLDEFVLELNRSAQTRLRCRSRLEIVPGATHLFEEPGTLTAAARLAQAWFARYLAQ